MKLKSNPADKVERRNIDRLIPYARNSRVHSPDQIAQLAASIKEWGWTNPILVDVDGQIIAGHGRLEAARMLKVTEVPVMVADGWTEAQKRAYVIADNKLALNSDWDTKLLSYEFDDLKEMGFDLDLTGFTLDEISALSPVEVKEGLTDEDAVPDVPEEPKTRLGDIYQLGRHRVMCGDSTSLSDVDTLMDGNKVDMVFTDPPYNVGFNGRSGKHHVIKNDNLSDSDFENFITEVCNTIEAVDPKVYYIWCNWNFYGILQGKLDYKTCIVWAKNVFGMGNGYRHQHEFCLFNGKIDEEIKNESDLWNIKKDTKYVHPTQKPVALSVRAFGNHVKLLNVLDLFGGSGSTLIGAEQTGRTAYLMELDPKYCDVIVKRWKDFTGKQAILIESNIEFSKL